MTYQADLFTPAKANRKRIYALASWQVKIQNGKWYYRKTDSDDPYKGPYSSESSVILMIARQLKRELIRRDGPHR